MLSLLNTYAKNPKERDKKVRKTTINLNSIDFHIFKEKYLYFSQCSKNGLILVSIPNVCTVRYMYFFFLDELIKFTISDFPKQTHLGYTLITLFFSYAL